MASYTTEIIRIAAKVDLVERKVAAYGYHYADEDEDRIRAEFKEVTDVTDKLLEVIQEHAKRHHLALKILSDTAKSGDELELNERDRVDGVRVYSAEGRRYLEIYIGDDTHGLDSMYGIELEGKYKYTYPEFETDLEIYVDLSDQNNNKLYKGVVKSIDKGPHLIRDYQDALKKHLRN